MPLIDGALLVMMALVVSLIGSRPPSLNCIVAVTVYVPSSRYVWGIGWSFVAE